MGQWGYPQNAGVLGLQAILYFGPAYQTNGS